MRPRYLTKSKFKLAMECPTKLFYAGKKEYYNNKSEDDWMQELARGGIQVGILAKKYFPNGIEIECDDYWNYERLITLTNEQLKKENVILYEAAIRYENCFIRVDILEKIGNSINFYEVKSKSFHPESDKNNGGRLFLNKDNEIHPDWKEYLYDVAFQALVINHSPQTKDFTVTPHLTLIDKSLKTNCDKLHSKFLVIKKNDRWIAVDGQNYTEEELGNKILNNVNVFEQCQIVYDTSIKVFGINYSFNGLIEKYSELYKEDEKHDVQISNKCKKCEYKVTDNGEITDRNKSGFHECFLDYTHREFDFSEPNILDIWDNRRINRFIGEKILYQQGLDISDLGKDKNDSPGMSRIQRQWKQIDINTGRETTEYFDRSRFNNYIQSFSYPRHFIDFETSRVAIPFEKGRHPYELYVFQFSCHIMKSETEFEHHEWINTDPHFPNFEFVRALKQVIADGGIIFRFSHYENTVLNTIHDQLAKYGGEISDAEELIEWIENVTYKKDKVTKEELRKGERCMVDLRDLCYWFYYHIKMNGSYSIKSLLPAIMESSDHLRDNYSTPLCFGSNLKGKKLWQLNPKTNLADDPYNLLDPLFSDTHYKEIKSKNIELLVADDKIKEGGAAMAAYSLMHFTEEMSNDEKEAIIQGLLNYCELDTLAMVMIWQHWNSLCKN